MFCFYKKEQVTMGSSAIEYISDKPVSNGAYDFGDDRRDQK